VNFEVGKVFGILILANFFNYVVTKARFLLFLKLLCYRF